MPHSSAHAPYRVLVCIGFDEASNPTFIEGARILRMHPQSELHAVQVSASHGSANTKIGMELLDEQLEATPKRLNQRVMELARTARWTRPVMAHVRIGDAARGILQTAIDIEADLIVIGTHHRRGLDRAVLGSVSESVVRDAHCPVLVVTPKNYEGLTRTQQPDPPCPACVTTRKASQMRRYWCEQHARPHLDTHVFELTEHSPSGPPTGMRIV